MCEATHYTYLDPETAKAFARDKWGQPEPRMAVEVSAPSMKPTSSEFEALVNDRVQQLLNMIRQESHRIQEQTNDGRDSNPTMRNHAVNIAAAVILIEEELNYLETPATPASVSPNWKVSQRSK